MRKKEEKRQRENTVRQCPNSDQAIRIETRTNSTSNKISPKLKGGKVGGATKKGSSNIRNSKEGKVKGINKYFTRLASNSTFNDSTTPSGLPKDVRNDPVDQLNSGVDGRTIKGQQSQEVTIKFAN